MVVPSFTEFLFYFLLILFFQFSIGLLWRTDQDPTMAAALEPIRISYAVPSSYILFFFILILLLLLLRFFLPEITITYRCPICGTFGAA